MFNIIITYYLFIIKLKIMSIILLPYLIFWSINHLKWKT